MGHFEAEKSSDIEGEGEGPSMDDVYGMIQGQRRLGGVVGEAPLVRKMMRRRSASAMKVGLSDSDADDDFIESRRPASVREGRPRPPEYGVDHEVDAKADDFINRFRQQLLLQRLDSATRHHHQYK